MAQSGIFVPCNEALRIKLKSKLPGLSADRLCSIAETHFGLNGPSPPRGKKGELNKALKPSQSLKYLSVLHAQVDALRTKLANVPESVENLMWEAKVVSRLPQDPMTVADAALHDLGNLLLLAERRRIPSLNNRPPGPNRFLIDEIAKVVRDAGLIADETPNGPLCVATKVILDDYGERHSIDAIRSMVYNILKKRA